MIDDWDKTLKVGDYVFSGYHKGSLLFKIIEIQKRYLTKDDLRYEVYKGCKVGDEYASYATIESVMDLGVQISPKKFRKIKRGLDISYLERATKDHMLEHMDRVQNALNLL